MMNQLAGLARSAPLSFIIDDSTCLVNMGHFCMPQFAAETRRLRKERKSPLRCSLRAWAGFSRNFSSISIFGVAAAFGAPAACSALIVRPVPS